MCSNNFLVDAADAKLFVPCVFFVGVTRKQLNFQHVLHDRGLNAFIRN